MTGDGWTRLGPGAEFDLVRRLRARWGGAARGLGDDAAVLDLPEGTRLVASTDTSLEGVHFRADWLTWPEIAYRAATASLSDLAAMAATPLGMLVAATIPATLAARIEDLADGLAEAGGMAGCPIVGGDLTRGDRASLTITVLGSAADPVGRGGARPGDGLYVTGRLGGPAAAIADLEAGRTPAPAHRERLARPIARLAEARWLAAHGASAMIDLSDGLSSDVRHLAAASATLIRVRLEALPVMGGVTPAAAAASGEEYELLVTAPDELDAAAFSRLHGVALTRIGEVVATGAPGAEFLLDGARVDLPRGYDHFSP